MNDDQIAEVIGLTIANDVCNRMLRIEQFEEDAIAVVTSRDSAWARKRRVKWSDLAAARWVLPPRDSLPRRAFVRTYLEQGIAPPQPVVETLAPLNIRSLIEFQAGDVGLLRVEHARAEEAWGALRIVPVTPVVLLPPLVVFTLRRARLRRVWVERLVSELRKAQTTAKK